VATLLGHAVEKAREEERDRAGRESQRRKREFGDQHAAFLLARVRALLEEMETRPEYGSSEEAARGLAGWTLESIYNAFEESVPRLSGPWRSQTACHAAGLALFGPEICGARFDEDADQNLDVTFQAAQTVARRPGSAAELLLLLLAIAATQRYGGKQSAGKGEEGESGGSDGAPVRLPTAEAGTETG
jgi:hypothetical protein